MNMEFGYVLVFLGWIVIFFINDRSSKRTEVRANFDRILSSLETIEKTAADFKEKNPENAATIDENQRGIFELKVSAKLSAIELTSRNVRDNLALIKDPVSPSLIAEIRSAVIDVDLEKIVDNKSQIEEELLNLYAAKYYKNMLSLYKIEIVTLILFSLATFVICFMPSH